MPPSIVNRIRFTVSVFKEAIHVFSAKEVMTFSAAMSYYMIFSFPAMLFAVLWVAARFYKEDDMRDSLMTEFSDLVGPDGAQQLMASIQQLDITGTTWWATLIGAGVLLFTATTVLVTTRKALNHIAGVNKKERKDQAILSLLRDRFVSSAMLATVAIILLVSLVVQALIGMFGQVVDGWFGGFSNFITTFDSHVLDFLATTVLVSVFFRYLPDIKLPWKDLWIGAVTTTVLLSGGQYLIGFIIGQSSAASLYAAAGSLLVLMLWVYYASALFLFGASLTFTRAKMLGRKPAA